MDISKLKPFLKDGVNEAELSTVVEGFNPLAGLKTAEEARALFLATPALKSAFDYLNNEAIKSYRANHFADELKEALDAEIKKLHPEETPEQKRLREQDDRIAALEKNNQEAERKLARERMKNNAAAELAKILPGLDTSPLLESLVVDEAEKTDANIKALQAVIDGAKQGATKAVMGAQTTTTKPGGTMPADARASAYNEAEKKGDFATMLGLAGNKG